MEGRVDRKKDGTLAGVKCVVNTCTYHESGDHCGAAKIEIQSRDAHSTEETDCATFAPRS